MTGALRKLAFAAALLVSVAAGAQAQQATAPTQAVQNKEGIQIGLSTDRVMLTADFSGANLTIFGALDEVDAEAARQNRYDVVVVLEGPAREVTVRRKSRVLGMWINTEAEEFRNVPVSYAIATTRVPQDITDATNYRRLSLGADNIYLEPEDPDQNPATLTEFTEALRTQMKETSLYSANYGGVEFLSVNLFRAELKLAASVPVGTHRARAYLFKNGVFIKESTAQLAIMKSGFEQWLYRSSQQHGFFYGLAAVALAMMIGWLGRIIFRRD